MEFLSQFLLASIFRSTTHAVIFIVCLLVSAGVLLYYSQRNPNPRFRPKLGELALVGIIFVGVSVAITGMTANLFDQENLDEAAKKARARAKEFDKGGGGGGGSENPDDPDDPNPGNTGFGTEEEVPPFIPDE